MRFEADIIRFLQLNMNQTWITIFQIISMFGSYLGFAITFLIIWFKKRDLSCALFFAYFISQFLNRILKRLIGRNRPFVDYEDIFNYGEEDGYSFPSGHSLGAGILATYLVYVVLNLRLSKADKTLAIVTITFFAVSVMLSRMTLGVHYLSDTIIGLILGISFAIISILLYNIFVKKYVGRKTMIGEQNGRNTFSGDKQ